MSRSDRHLNLVEMSITLEPHCRSRSHVAYICMSSFPNHWHATPPFLMYEGLLSISPACCDQLVKILIALGPYGIFESNVAFLFIQIMSSMSGI